MDDLNDDVICELYETILDSDNDSKKRSLINLAATCKRMNELAQRYLYRDIINYNKPKGFANVREYYYVLCTKPLISQTLRNFFVELWPMGDHGYYLHTTNVFSLLKHATRLTNLCIQGQPNYCDEDDRYVENEIEVEEVKRAIKEIGLKELPMLHRLEAHVSIGSSLFLLCPTLEELILDGYGGDLMIKALKRAKKAPSLRLLQIAPSHFDKNLATAILMHFGGLRRLHLKDFESPLEHFKYMPGLLGRLPELQEVILPDIKDLGDRYSHGYAKQEEGFKVRMEVVARMLFQVQSALKIVSFWTYRSDDRCFDHNIYEARWELQDRLGVQRDRKGKVEKLLWLQESWHTRFEIEDEACDSRKGEQDVSAWQETYGDDAKAFFNKFAAF